MMCADDVVFRTRGWDDKVSAVMTNPKSTLHFVWGNDLNQGENIATLPFMSRCLIESMGYFVPRGYIHDYCDTHLHHIAQHLKHLGINIMKYLNNVVFEHMHPTVNKAKWDKTYKYRQNLGPADNHYSSLSGHRKQMAKKLYDLIDNDKVKVPQT